jgi:HPt (histidine-containing phosphotransfer) domain-containing protein
MEAQGLQMVLSIAELDSSVLVGLIDSVLENTPGLLEHLEAGINEKNTKQIKISAHSLKSSFNLIGATAIANTCQAIETISQEGKITGIEDIFLHVKSLYTELVKDLNQWKNDLDNQ